MPINTGCQIQEILGSDTPNQGRVKINNNFDCIFSAVTNAVANDTYLTGGTYNSLTESIDFSGTTLFPNFSVDVSALLDDTNTFVTGGTFSTGTLTLERNDGNSVSVTGFTSDNFYTTGATLNGTVLEFDRTDLLNAYNVELSGLTGNLLYTQTNNYTLGVPITINHNLNTTDVLVQVVDANTNQLIYGSINNYQTNSLDVTLSISLNNVKVLVIGSPISQIVPKGSIVYTLGHDSISPTDNNNYYIGQNFNLSPIISSNDGRRFIAQKTGLVTQLSIKRSIGGSLGSNETNSFYINNVTQVTQTLVTSGETFDSSSSLNNYILSTPLNVTAGDKIEIEWITPAWATNPTTVRHIFNMIIEY